MQDLTTLTQAELDALQAAVVAEQDRRWRLATAPAQVAAIREQFVADGGDPSEL